jgi:hypothetical protein
MESQSQQTPFRGIVVDTVSNIKIGCWKSLTILEDMNETSLFNHEEPVITCMGKVKWFLESICDQVPVEGSGIREPVDRLSFKLQCGFGWDGS